MSQSTKFSAGELERNSPSFLNHLNLEKVLTIEVEILVPDILSMVFLLYDDVPVALERLTLLLLGVNPNRPMTNLSLLLDWVISNQSDPKWRDKLLETFVLCQCNKLIRMLGVNLPEALQHFQVSSHCHIHPVKKVLYQMCETMDVESCRRFVARMKSKSREIAAIDVRNIFDCHLEFYLFKLMAAKTINIGKYSNEKMKFNRDNQCSIAFIIELCETVNPKICKCLIEVEKRINDNFIGKSDACASTDTTQQPKETGDISAVSVQKRLFNLNDFKYPIINALDVGICVIINQTTFRESIITMSENIILEKRNGTEFDRDRLVSTWKKFNVRSIIFNDVDREDIIPNITSVIKTHVMDHHSVFVVCILSHGAKGVFYGADGLPLEIDKLNESMFGINAPILIGKPKLIIVQACQGTQRLSNITTDNPTDLARKRPLTTADVSDLCIFWSSLPNFVSVRDTACGTWFIQTLCDVLEESDGSVHIGDLFKLVTNLVSEKRDGHSNISMHPMSTTEMFRKCLYLPKPLQ